MSDLISNLLGFPFLFTVQVGSCLAMAGLIWLVQLVHYPAFSYVEDSQFTEFESFHSFRISWIVIPLMILELASAFFLALSDFNLTWGANLTSVFFIWVSTAVLSVPCHIKLDKSKDESVIRRLVATNWPRTVLWTLRSIFLLFILNGFLSS